MSDIAVGATYNDTIQKAKHLVTEAEFSIINKDNDDNANVPALNDTDLRRHQLLRGKPAEYLQKISDELEIDKKLGLRNQALHTADRALQQDIDSLVSSKDYIQVSKRDLEKLFKIPMLKNLCFIRNISEVVGVVWSEAKLGIMCFAAFLLTLYPMIVFSSHVFGHPATNLSIFLGILNIIAWVGELILVIAAFMISFGDKRSYDFEFSDASLDSKALDEVDIKIPYGAKLKVLEAQETAIFKNFIMFYPSFSIKHYTVDMRTTPFGRAMQAFANDPAILGVTEDKRMFLIVYWDIKHDIEKVVKSIKTFKKFKV